MNRRPRLSALRVLVAATAITTTAVSGVASAAPKPTGKPVKLMVIGIFSGGGLDFSDVPRAAKAAADAINDDGGIDGRPVKVIECDTGIDPNQAEACARRAVDEGVVAVVGAFTEYQYLPLLEQAGIPSVAPYGVGFDELTSPLSFPIGATAIGGTGGMGALLADKGAKRIDVSFLDVPGGAGRAAADFVNYALEPRGVPTATSTPEPFGGADLLPSVQATIDKDPDGVVLVTTDPEYSKWVLAYRQAGGTAKLAAPGGSVNPTNVEALGEAAEGIYVSTNFKPASLTKDPGVKQMLEEVRAFDKGIRLVDGSIGAWAGVHLVADALEGASTVDSATLVARLGQDTTWDTRVGPPVNFSRQPPEIAAAGGLLLAVTRVFTTDVYYARIKNGKVRAIDDEPHSFLVP